VIAKDHWDTIARYLGSSPNVASKDNLWAAAGM
jgi:hypothetical protein